ncbi:hypothetical protein QBC37DRAFT_294558 [Rhypophila decipiens]|uniref:Rhodopsin domain-containing protein n=1 Tax=Rhypophila decipiens TaxID=261697 RepID=A0AAN7B405_9PEZI|nr:hypothetical protein QBC37DRAFT_294558 [Rhypophila decipiens]
MSTTIPPAPDTSGFLSAGIVLSIFTAVIVSVRLLANLHTTGKPHLDDSQGDPALFTTSDPRPAIRRIAQYAEAEIFLSGFAMWTAKLPVLVLLARIFGIYRGVRITSIITIVVLGLAIISADIYNAVICAPPSADDILPVYLGFMAKCTDASSLTGVILAPIGLAADVVIFILPLPAILKLQLSLQKKIGLLVVFLFGLLAIAVTAVSTKFKFDSRSGKTTDVQLAMELSILETTIVIAAGCVPAVKAFWATFIVKSGWYSRLTSLLSHTSSRNITRAKGSKGSQDSQETGRSNIGPMPNINQYYQLEDQNRSTRKLVADVHVRPVGNNPLPW